MIDDSIHLPYIPTSNYVMDAYALSFSVILLNDLSYF